MLACGWEGSRVPRPRLFAGVLFSGAMVLCRSWGHGRLPAVDVGAAALFGEAARGPLRPVLALQLPAEVVHGINEVHDIDSPVVVEVGSSIPRRIAPYGPERLHQRQQVHDIDGAVRLGIAGRDVLVGGDVGAGATGTAVPRMSAGTSASATAALIAGEPSCSRNRSTIERQESFTMSRRCRRPAAGPPTAARLGRDVHVAAAVDLPVQVIVGLEVLEDIADGRIPARSW